ncbi:uncharacterized protein Z518_10802 [Rhinocladiella mackenziei CBS 650.93]|uniref:Peptidase S54 rhomboid domain-containing protein n=1 Tax=Rhinocladiella mackenziei CBS 650.93 TaxID=1442369 RepID=A0A0D2IT13_9EURO|nr:uncharacterized protein Z518_10802 [Rhinocladiella mackenziei CBS 650.93]KIW99874.1 hypothetical protein Z518_10802 [Rhinocladiella mackenziei CBS 650.93]
MPFSILTPPVITASCIAQKLKPYGSDKKPEKGLKFRDVELSRREVLNIFGSQAPPTSFANRLLRVLHGRRHDGTLDLPLPDDVQSQLHKYPYAFDDGLHWLRQTYPIDEDAAIMARIDREEHELERDNPADLIQRGQDLGLYRGPQSGHYEAKLSDKEGDVWGVSELEKIREENMARAAKEEEELDAQIEEQIARLKSEQTKAIAQRPEHGLQSAKEVRPPNSVERWVLKARNRATSKLALESPEIAEMTISQRLFPSFIFVALLCGGGYLFAQYWERPKQSERLFPDVSMSFATVGTLVLLNFAIFGAWRIPPLWRPLNKYFIIVPGYPYAFSMLGSLFSHQKFTHFLLNMGPLILFGLPLHEEVGRGTFMAIYLSSGLIAGFTGLARFAIQRLLTTSTLGASGCVYGTLAAYLTLHADDKYALFFLPPDLAESFSFRGSSLLAGITLMQVIGNFRALHKIGYLDHLVGIVVGCASAYAWQMNQPKRDPPKKQQNWWENLVGRKP